MCIIKVDLIEAFVQMAIVKFWNSKENARILPKYQCQTGG